ncbi:recombinase family protein [Acetobacter ghanensis]|uniref:recombinase family protein n=1 Tax=Acetobacter ghanensis TaxID=431306 RepID=UPI003D353CAC
MGKLRLGYARVSTDDQTTALRADAFQRAGCHRVYQDTASGKSSVARARSWRSSWSTCARATPSSFGAWIGLGEGRLTLRVS